MVPRTSRVGQGKNEEQVESDTSQTRQALVGQESSDTFRPDHIKELRFCSKSTKSPKSFKKQVRYGY